MDIRKFTVIQSIVLLIAFSSAPCSIAVPQKNPTAARTKSAVEVFQSIVDAYGGAENIKAHRRQAMRTHASISASSGISSAENTYECDILEKGDNVRVEMTMLGLPKIIAFDGKNSWQQNGDWIEPASPSTTALISNDTKHGLPAILDGLDPQTRFELLPKRSVHGKPCDVIRLTSVQRRATTFFADEATHRILRAEYEGTDHETGATAQQSIEYSDYRPVAGSIEPFKAVHFSGDCQKSETTIKAIDADVAIDDKLFHMPPESEIARLKNGPLIIPFEYSGNQILVKARINGAPEQAFILDTGASQSVIDKSTAAALGAHPTPTFSITSGSQAVPVSYTKLNSLALGDVTIYDVPVLITDLSNIGDHKPAGLIGTNILRRFLVTIDYDEKKLILSDPRTATVPANGTALPIKPVFGGASLIVTGQLDDKKSMSFLVDTGASFNNLPQTLSKPLYAGSLLPVGVIYELGGQKTNIGTLKAHSLKLGGLTVPNPVFTIAPDRNPTRAGLLTSGAMGILGNPIWAQFKTTVDYRNERLILEAQSGHEKRVKLMAQMEQVERDYLKSKNEDDALKAYEKVLAGAQVEQQKSVEALCISRIASCYAEKYAKTKETKWLDLAIREYEHASKVANESHSRSVEGQVLADWALMYLNSPRSYSDVTNGQNLLSKALQKAPMEPSIYAAFGTTLLRVGKKPEADKLLDRALFLDPSNWQALWAKYKIYQSDKKDKEQALVAEQLHYYYPGFPEVLALSPAPAPTKKPRP